MLLLAARDRHIAARGRERQRDAATNAGAASRHEGGFTFQEIGLERIDGSLSDGLCLFDFTRLERAVRKWQPIGQFARLQHPGHAIDRLERPDFFAAVRRLQLFEACAP